MYVYVFFVNDPAPTDISTLPLHDPLPISRILVNRAYFAEVSSAARQESDRRFLADCMQKASWLEKSLDQRARTVLDRKSTRLNSSHANISYAVFCLKKKHPYSYPPSLLLL